MHNLKHSIRSVVLAVCIVVVALLLPLIIFGGSAAAAGEGAVTFTQTFQNASETLPFANPCTGAPGTATITFNGVMHVTFVTSGPGAGSFLAVGNETGDGMLTPTDPSLPSYSGTFSTHFDDADNLHNGADSTTLSIHATGSDGSTLDFHMVEHFSISATGVTVSFDNLTCG